MKCFIHINEEAISVCKKCGKAMCVNCSAYSGHSGICPECRREEYIAESARLNAELNRNKSSFIISIVLAVIFAVVAIVLAIKLGAFFAVLLVGTVVFAVRILIILKRRKPLTERLSYLTGEINKLGLALRRGTANI
ncbi:MAG: hypothetical protein K2N30_03605 [Clostridia bacterium]|nr:hypothetical protein [Clostridia bacterium]